MCKIEVANRYCLECSRTFRSLGKGVRICPSCKERRRYVPAPANLFIIRKDNKDVVIELFPSLVPD